MIQFSEPWKNPTEEAEAKQVLDRKLERIMELRKYFMEGEIRVISPHLMDDFINDVKKELFPDE